LITEEKLSFKVKDANFETLFGLQGLTQESLSNMLLMVDIDRREKMIKILQRVKDPRAAEILCAFLDKKPVTDSLVVTALAKIGNDALNPLKVLLKSEKETVRLAAMNVLANIKSPDAIDALVHMLDDSSVEVRRAAIWDLNENDSKWMLRDEAKDTLGILKDELHEFEPEKRAFAAWALGMTKNCHALPALRLALEDSSPEVRENAAFAIGEIQDPTAGEALEKALKDEDSDVRKSALTALRKIDPERVRALTRSTQKN
jgi:HEAT repeat protein